MIKTSKETKAELRKLFNELLVDFAPDREVQDFIRSKARRYGLTTKTGLLRTAAANKIAKRKWGPWNEPEAENAQ